MGARRDRGTARLRRVEKAGKRRRDRRGESVGGAGGRAGRVARSIGMALVASGSKKSRRAESGAVGKACIRATSG